MEAILIVASNRGPAEFHDNGGGLYVSRAAGGLASSILRALEGKKCLWVAAAMTETEQRIFSEKKESYNLREIYGDPYSEVEVSYISFDQQMYRGYYDGISSGILWFALHGIFDSSRRPVFDSRAYALWEDCYEEVNRRFGERIGKTLEGFSGDAPKVVLVQDYHLFSVPKFLRRTSLEDRAAFFLHTPFPTPQQLSMLPATWARSILEGMMSLDLVGFHCSKWLENFLACCKELLGAETANPSRYEESVGIHSVVGYGDRTVAAGVFPIGPDKKALLQEAESEEVERALSAMDIPEDAFVVVSVERVDPAKNALRSLRAIDEVLDRCEELRGRLRFLLLMYPSRERLVEYRAYEIECETLAEAVNRRWSTESWKPVSLDISDDYARSLAALRRYDVLLVNSIADGMNLVAREGPLLNRRSGQIVLSRNTGAFEIYGDACLPVNPFDVVEQAAAIEEVFKMSPEARKQRANRLASLAARDDPRGWLDAQVKAALAVSPL
jgi:trehalose 6-phosphate synthase